MATYSAKGFSNNRKPQLASQVSISSRKTSLTMHVGALDQSLAAIGAPEAWKQKFSLPFPSSTSYADQTAAGHRYNAVVIYFNHRFIQVHCEGLIGKLRDGAGHIGLVIVVSSETK